VGIALVAVGDVDQDILKLLKEDLNKIFGKQVWIGKGMPAPHDAFNKNGNPYEMGKRFHFYPRMRSK
jgi:predicted Zn-dependent protease